MHGLLNLILGMGASVCLGVVLWMLARSVRGAKAGSFWDKEGVASGLSLVLVGSLVIALAWTIKGAMEIVPEPIIGASVGLVASLIAVFIPMKLFGRLPTA